MPNFSPDIINRLSEIQGQIWQTVSATVSEASGAQVSFSAPLTVLTQPSELSAEFTGSIVSIQFAFAGQPENMQIVLVPLDTVEALAAGTLEDEFQGVDENVLADMRSTFEGIVQGICLAVGTMQNEAIVASGLTIRHLPFAFPPSLQNAEELARVQVAVQIDDQTGTATWLTDYRTVAAILDLEDEDSTETPFPQVSADAKGDKRAPEDSSSLDLLMDIPLEVSVELGRVRMLVKDVLELGTGSIVEIDKLAGEPVDVLVNGQPVARGEVVVIEDNFGVRITEIINPHERVNKLGEAA